MVTIDIQDLDFQEIQTVEEPIPKNKKSSKKKKKSIRNAKVISVRKATMVIDFNDGTGAIIAKRDGIKNGDIIDVEVD